jgi:hypothetical protein
MLKAAPVRAGRAAQPRLFGLTRCRGERPVLGA